MSRYLFDCHKCTNKAISSDGSVYCLPCIEGRPFCYIKSGTTGRDYVLDCDEFTTEERDPLWYEAVKITNDNRKE